MEDDPWGSSADPWNKTSSDGPAVHSADVLDSSLQEGDDLGPVPSLAVPARSNGFSDSDPWASPVKSFSNAEATAITALDTTPPTKVPDLSDDISLPRWTDEPRVVSSRVPDREDDIPVPKVQWGAEDTVDDNAWSVPKTASPPHNAMIEDQSLQTIDAEQVPLPDDEDTQLEDHPPSRLDDHDAGDTWDVSHVDEDYHNAASDDLPSFADAEPTFGEEDENYNPFSGGDQTQKSTSEEFSRGFAASPQEEEDDAFGGFATGGAEESHGQSGFAGATDNDTYGAWGNDDVQGFSSAWGSGSAGDAEEDDVPTAFHSSSRQNRDALGIDDEEGFHTVASRGKIGATADRLQEDEWAAERRRIASQEARAPLELIIKLADQWKDVLHQVYTPTELVDSGKDVEEGLDPETVIRKDRLMTTLTELPDGMSIFVQPPQNTVTWALYQEYLSTIKLDPSASILAKASAESAYRAARRKSQEEHDAWQARSRLGEGHDQSSHSASALQDAGEARPKWSLWGRKASTPMVPLTTSGGGLLEVKALSPNPTGAPTNHQSRMSMQPASAPTSSRSTPPPIRSADSQTPSDHDAGILDPAPSAVGRFLGRFRRPKTVTPSADISNKDLELSQDDFSFLADVPALPTKANTHDVDLLSLDDIKPSGQMTSLEAMLNSTPLPSAPHLNPPPRPAAHRGSSSAHRLSTATNTYSQSTSKSNSMIDLFGDLDLGNATSTKPTPPVSSGLGIDSFKGSSNPPKTRVDHAFPPSAMMLPKPLHVSADLTNPAFGMATSSEDDGFGDFGEQSQTKINHTFDDFGDFEAFSTESTAKPKDAFTLHSAPTFEPQGTRATAVPQFDSALLTGRVQASPSRLDHTSTARLVQTAAQQSSQWPASVSPSIPALPPPTSSIRQSAPIPPPPTSGSRKGTPLNFDFLGIAPPTVAPSRSHTASPAPPLLATSNPASRSQTPQLSKGQGLSASDLSFFDSL